jgi:hypothetical protein
VQDEDPQATLAQVLSTGRGQATVAAEMLSLAAMTPFLVGTACKSRMARLCPAWGGAPAARQSRQPLGVGQPQHAALALAAPLLHPACTCRLPVAGIGSEHHSSLRAG